MHGCHRGLLAGHRVERTDNELRVKFALEVTAKILVVSLGDDGYDILVLLSLCFAFISHLSSRISSM